MVSHGVTFIFTFSGKLRNSELPTDFIGTIWNGKVDQIYY